MNADRPGAAVRWQRPLLCTPTPVLVHGIEVIYPMHDGRPAPRCLTRGVRLADDMVVDGAETIPPLPVL
jgi:hypothetical protein